MCCCHGHTLTLSLDDTHTRFSHSNAGLPSVAGEATSLTSDSTLIVSESAFVYSTSLLREEKVRIWHLGQHQVRSVVALIGISSGFLLVEKRWMLVKYTPGTRGVLSNIARRIERQERAKHISIVLNAIFTLTPFTL